MKAVTLSALSAIALSACAGSGALPRPPAPFAGDSAAFVTTLGSDTMALELFTIRGNTLEAEVVGRTPRTFVRRVRMAWNDDGKVTSYETRVRGPEAHRDSARAVTTWAVGPDSITVTNTPSTRPPSRMANAGVSTVLALPAYSTFAVLARKALTHGDTLVLAQFGGDPLPFMVKLESPATYSFTAPQLGTILVQLDAVGRVHMIDARRSTLGAVARRVSTVNLPAWISDYAARDAAGRGLGPLSPADTVRANVGGASVSIAYQRPSVRGREIFGGPVVPWGTVWRTGANSATGFTTDRDLMVGNVRVPAGSYTLWTIPNPGGWQLIINRQTGQWGTVYNQDRDLARIPMTAERLSTPVEQFTLAIAGGRLSLAWDDWRAWVPIAIAP